MPVPASINDLSTTAGNNSPAGGEAPSTVDDYLRTLSAFIASLRDTTGTLGTGKQAADPTLTALAGLATGADRLPYFTGTDTAAQATLTAFARTLLDDADAATMRATLGVVFAAKYVSAEQAITSGGLLTLTHNLGAAPELYRLSLVCQSAEHGYSVGDVVETHAARDQSDTGVVVKGVSVVGDATNISVRYVNNTAVFGGLNKGTGAPTAFSNASWRLIVRAWA